ncbi:MAG TPA: zinc metalloprotease HtpX, partial [Thermoanaerobaculaceae bacterium]|nr:zinc metalloprotease HtpX [Thermoanaerobaculaceae bacterium]
MPYTFVEIEERRGRRIALLFATLLVVYLAGALLVCLALFPPALPLGLWLANRGAGGAAGALHGYGPALVVLTAAVGACLLHWFGSVRGMVRRTLELIGAQPLDPADAYHRRLGNVVAEVAVATGGRRIEAVAVPARWMNAFALADFTGRQVIGVSERLLVSLSRAELEAVVGHEAAHLVEGDSLLATASCSMAAVWAGLLRALVPDADEGRDHGAAVRIAGRFGLVIAVVALMRGLTVLLNAWISREREYRADATAVRLTRDPLSLARALRLIAADPRRGFLPEEALAPLFILDRSRRADELQDASGPLSTHPPVARRLEALLGMAHAGRDALDDGGPAPTPPADTTVGKSAPPQRWRALDGQAWRGPFTAAELVALPWFGPFTPVTESEPWLAAPAWQHAEINRLLKRLDGPPSHPGACPACGGALAEVAYEGVPLHRCAGCRGRLIGIERFARIVARGEPQLPPEVHALAVRLLRERAESAAGRPAAAALPDGGPPRRCPVCAATMRRFAYQAILPHRIMLDRCDACGLLWFDADELEVIQEVLTMFGT